ncbi:MAG TPA: hypothetical protein VFG35_20860 [Actinoplanes sp.]|nr:hypothetical protein [Actinoplanes sp.]
MEPERQAPHLNLSHIWRTWLRSASESVPGHRVVLFTRDAGPERRAGTPGRNAGLSQGKPVGRSGAEQAEIARLRREALSWWARRSAGAR